MPKNSGQLSDDDGWEASEGGSVVEEADEGHLSRYKARLHALVQQPASCLVEMMPEITNRELSVAWCLLHNMHQHYQCHVA